MIELVHLEKKYENSTPLKDVNIVINDGDIISVIGPSGTGKTTLIRCINMLERPTGGQILMDGVDITAPEYDLTPARRRMGMVFQSFNLFGHLTVIENLMMAPMDILKKPKREAFENGLGLLRRVGLEGMEYQYPHQLSGGQKQRAAIARTVAMDPDLILLDEPTSALDPTMVGEVQTVIRDLSRLGKTMMIVTHELAFARSICNRVFYMDQGGIYEEGTPEQIFDHPGKERTRRFVRRLKVLELDIGGGTYDFPGMGSEIDRYCFSHDIPQRMKNRIHLIFEELVQQILMPTLEKPKLRFTAAYSGIKKQAEITILYNGAPFDPADSDNTISLALVKAAAVDLCHTVMDEDGFTNLFRCMIEEAE